MPPRAKAERLPDHLRAELDRRLMKSGFGGYVALSEWLAGQGYAIGKSALGEYGANLERKLRAIKASTEAARMIAESAPDDADQRSAAVISLIQTEVFDVLVKLQESEAEDDPMARAKLLSAVARNVATLSRASVNQKKWEMEMRGKVAAAADRAAKVAKKGGLTAGAVDTIRREILGIAA